MNTTEVPKLLELLMKLVATLDTPTAKALTLACTDTLNRKVKESLVKELSTLTESELSSLVQCLKSYESESNYLRSPELMANWLNSRANTNISLDGFSRPNRRHDVS